MDPAFGWMLFGIVAFLPVWIGLFSVLVKIRYNAIGKVRFRIIRDLYQDYNEAIDAWCVRDRYVVEEELHGKWMTYTQKFWTIDDARKFIDTRVEESESVSPQQSLEIIEKYTKRGELVK
jgi:hypothetical protein